MAPGGALSTIDGALPLCDCSCPQAVTLSEVGFGCVWQCRQVATCEQLHAYLNKFVAAESVAAAPAAAAAVNVPEGFKAMKKKGEDDDKMDGESSLRISM